MPDAPKLPPPGTYQGSAVVEVVDTMPPDPPAAAPWFRDPWKLGLVALAGMLVLTVLIPPRRS